MGDPTLYRGFLNGAFRNDSSDTSDDPGCEAQVIVKDLFSEPLWCKLVLPNDAPLPSYAAKIWLWDKHIGGGYLRRVIVRRDLNDSGNACLYVVVQPMLQGTFIRKWGTLEDPLAPAEFAEIMIHAPDGTAVGGKLGYLPSSYGAPDLMEMYTPITITTRARSMGGLPGGYEYAWVIEPRGIAATSTYPGQIESGSGDTYVVNIYPDGVFGDPVAVDVTQLQIATGEDLPIGTWVLVVKAGGDYYMQAPVWL